MKFSFFRNCFYVYDWMLNWVIFDECDDDVFFGNWGIVLNWFGSEWGFLGGNGGSVIVWFCLNEINGLLVVWKVCYWDLEGNLKVLIVKCWLLFFDRIYYC